MSNILRLLRNNIRDLEPYSSARNEFEGTDAIMLDANESPYNGPYNRYPDPLQKDLKKKIADNINSSQQSAIINYQQIFLGNGSDEAIDLLIRAFCEPKEDNVIIPEPSYGMYEVCANINNVEIRKVLLTNDFHLDIEKIKSITNQNSKLIFLCSPNNPTSNCFNKEDIINILESFDGIVVLDEAYIDFAESGSYLKYLNLYPNLVILQTFSKSWAMAGVRLGLAFAGEEIIGILNKIKYPYNVNMLTQLMANEIIDESEKRNAWIKTTLEERKRLEKELIALPFVEKVYPSDSNFLLVKFAHHDELFSYLISQKIIVRDRSKQKLCEGCIRITVGTPEENIALLNTLRNFKF